MSPFGEAIAQAVTELRRDVQTASLGLHAWDAHHLQDQLVAAAQQHCSAPARVLYARHLHHLALSDLRTPAITSQHHCWLQLGLHAGA